MKVTFRMMAVALFMIAYMAHGQNITFPHDGLDRQYLIHIPEDLPESPALVFVLHGYGMDNSQMMSSFDWTELADERGFVVAFPNGTIDKSNNHFWDVNYPIHEGIEIDDDGFLRELAIHLQTLHGLNPNSTFVTGFSNGGDMSYQLACRESETFTGFAPVAGTMMDSLYTDCTPAVPHSILLIHGSDDPVVLFEGDMDNTYGWGPYRSIPEIVAFWENVLETPEMERTFLPDIDPNDGSTVRLDTYSSTQHNRELWYYLIMGGGHGWPGIYGNLDIDATLEIWNFFDSLAEDICSEADLNGDGAVTVSDILLVISAWGDPYGVNDILIVTKNWGLECALPSGACCMTDGTCTYIQSSECEDVGGQWDGPLSSCTTICCLDGEYDECFNAMLVTNGATPFSTLCATTSTDYYDDSLCPGDWLGDMGADIWFSYEATCSGLLTVSTCNSATFDTSLVLYQGICFNKVQVACDGDGDNCSGYTSHLETQVTFGERYLIRLGGWSSSSSGTGTLNITCE